MDDAAPTINDQGTCTVLARSVGKPLRLVSVVRWCDVRLRLVLLVDGISFVFPANKKRGGSVELDVYFALCFVYFGPRSFDRDNTNTPTQE